MSRKTLVFSLIIFLLSILNVASANDKPLIVSYEIIGNTPQISVNVPNLKNHKFQEIINEQLEQHPKRSISSYQKGVANIMTDPVAKHFTLLSDYEVKINTAKTLSIVQKSYMYTGGAHGQHFVTTQTFDLTNGQLITLDKLFNNNTYIEQFNKMIAQEIARRNKSFYWFKGIDANQKFFLTPEGLFLLFERYQIAPYSEGNIYFFFPYSDLKELKISSVVW